jgi:hypothetical protein
MTSKKNIDLEIENVAEQWVKIILTQIRNSKNKDAETLEINKKD